jgi:hypothetical protein
VDASILERRSSGTSDVDDGLIDGAGRGISPLSVQLEQVQTLVMGQSCQIIAGTHQLNPDGKYKSVVFEMAIRKLA